MHSLITSLTATKKKRAICLGIIIALITALTGCCIVSKQHGWFSHVGKFYAVFLTNDQIYFGRITKKTNEEFVLSNVYYLKANTPVAIDSENAVVAQPNATAKLSLVKLGKEMYGPKSELVINWNHVLMYQEMTDNSEVMTAIKKQEIVQ